MFGKGTKENNCIPGLHDSPVLQVLRSLVEVKIQQSDNVWIRACLLIIAMLACICGSADYTLPDIVRAQLPSSQACIWCIVARRFQIVFWVHFISA